MQEVVDLIMAIVPAIVMIGIVGVDEDHWKDRRLLR